MIGWLSGHVRSRLGDALVVDVSGVGYLVHVSDREPVEVGDDVALWVHTVVREDALALYGFGEALERELFIDLIGVSGVGPKMALALLGTLTVAELVDAVQSEDVKTLSRPKGIGKRIAGLIIVKLRDRLSEQLLAAGIDIERTDAPSSSGGTELTRAARDAVSALSNLGYRGADAQEAVAEAMNDGVDVGSFDALLRAGLSRLSRRKGGGR
jgi:Holliday junction DNA helicase RuvA